MSPSPSSQSPLWILERLMGNSLSTVEEQSLLLLLKGFTIGVGTGAAVAVVVTLGPQAILQSLVGRVLQAARNVPRVSELLDQAELSALQSIMDELSPVDPFALTEIPSEGESPLVLVQRVKAGLDEDVAHGFLQGKAFAGIYHLPISELSQLQGQIMTQCLNTNALYPAVFKSCKKMEAEAVAMVVSMLKGRLGVRTQHPGQGQSHRLGTGETGSEGVGEWVDPAPLACGIMTSGGTESIFMAVKAYRDQFRARRLLGSSQVVPEVVACLTCHPALDKACEALGLVLIKLPADPVTQQMDVTAVQRAITANTAFLYASAPSFPHGVVDPIPELARLAVQHAVGLHVDNCLGGILLSYALAAQSSASAASASSVAASATLAPIPLFDFRVPGVTSLSTDLHKYGYAPKGASVVAFRDDTMRRFAYSVVTDWPGGLYTTPTAAGSRSGAPAAAAWATLCFEGGEGYAAMAALNQRLLANLAQAVQDIPQLALVGRVQACTLAFTTSSTARFHIYAFAARMEARGFHLNSLQHPAALMYCISERFAEQIDDFVQALRDCVAEANENPHDPTFEGKGEAGIYGASAVLPAKEIGRILKRYCDILYLVRKK
jgi:sphinganine-1-phosphate aldolase